MVFIPFCLPVNISWTATRMNKKDRYDINEFSHGVVNEKSRAKLLLRDLIFATCVRVTGFAKGVNSPSNSQSSEITSTGAFGNV